MDSGMQGVLEVVLGLNWLELVKAAAPVATALIAFKALKNWQRQDRAKKEAEFLDQLVETMHSYTVGMTAPFRKVAYAQFRMYGHLDEEDDEKRFNGIERFIKSDGASESEALDESLHAARNHAGRLHLLLAKGRVFQMENYSSCHAIVEDAIRLSGKVSVFSATLDSESVNWRELDMRKHLLEHMTIDIDDMRQQLSAANSFVLRFAAITYANLYR